MRLLSLHDGKPHLTEYLGGSHPPYAILSHTWGTQAEEVSFWDLMDGSGIEKAGYHKIQFCGSQAAADGLSHFWIDTCCIDKSNSTELSEAINSMFRWYREASRCYVYMSDVSTANPSGTDDHSRSAWESAFRESRWFTRSWTLQELLAPQSVEFFTSEGRCIGDKQSLEPIIHQITGIPVVALQGGDLSEFSVEERMSWAEHRRSTREEDDAYGLLGIFDIHISPIYGEGRNHAFRRLRKEILDYERQKTEAESHTSFPLHQAARDGDLGLVKKYLRGRILARVNDVDDSGQSALHYPKTAAIADVLIDAGALINLEDVNGQTPLHRASMDRRLDVIRTLLAAGARRAKKDAEGNTAKDYATDCPAANWMLGHEEGSDGLFHMAWLGDVEGVKFFLSQDADVDVSNDNGETPLTEASRHGDTEVVGLLLENGADMEVRTEGGWTPLLLAVTNNRKDVVETLVLAGAKLDTTEDRNHDAVSEAVYEGHWEVARMLIEHGAKLDSTTLHGNTPLHCSGHRAPPSFTRYLLEKGARVNAQNLYGGTALLETVSRHPNEPNEHIAILLEYGANPNLANHEGYSPMSDACRVGNSEAVKALLKVIPNPSFPSNALLPGPNSWTPLSEACYNVKPDCVQLLLDAGVELETRNDEGYTALHHATREVNSSVEIVKMLVERGVFLESEDRCQRTPLACAAQYSTVEVVQALIDAGANINTRCQGGDPPENGHTPLHLAIERGDEGIVEALVDAGANLEAKTAKSALTPLMMAVNESQWEIASILVKGGANVNTCDTSRKTPLMAAAKAGERPLINKMLDHGADPGLRDNVGRTALIWAKHEGWPVDFEPRLNPRRT